MHLPLHSVAILILFRTSVQAILLDVYDDASIKNAASIVAYGLMTYYTGNQSGNAIDEANIGLFPSPYYWWEAGGVWGGLVEYWHYTNDTSYVYTTTQALLSQFSSTNDFMPPAENSQLGNDDQGFWALAAMSAAEYDLPNQLNPQAASWLTVCINVFNDWVSRWIDPGSDTCGGGLKWQIFKGHRGYDYKSAVANGAFFQLSARLTRMTGNETYLLWADRVWNWTNTIGLMDAGYNVFDGTDDTINCSAVDHVQWTYNIGSYLYGSAVLYNYTNGSDIWTTRTAGLLDAVATFLSPFPNTTNTLYEAFCEEALICDTDEQSFKAYLARWLAASAKVAPFTNPAISELLRVSAGGAALSCSGGSDNKTCGSKWYIGGWDGTSGVGQQLAALEVIQGVLLNFTQPPIHQPDVHISLAPNMTNRTVPVPEVTATSRPLFDHPETGLGVKQPDMSWMWNLVTGFLGVALVMVRC